jgi:hypothetical protein
MAIITQPFPGKCFREAPRGVGSFRPGEPCGVDARHRTTFLYTGGIFRGK